MTYKLTVESENRRTGIKTVVNWHPDNGVVAEYFRKDGSFIKAETLGYAINDEGFMRLAATANLP